MLGSDGLPTSIDLSDVAPFGYGNATTGISVETFGGSQPYPFFSGNFSSLQFQSVPEPATDIMLGLAIAVLGLGRKYLNAARRDH